MILWLAFVFVMSTGGFSTENTFSVVHRGLAILAPWLDAHQIAALNHVIRKSAHVFEYFVLGFLLLRAFHTGSPGWSWRLTLFPLAGVFLWAIGDEFHQSFVSSRMSSIRDVAIDTTGGILAQFAGAFWYRYVARENGSSMRRKGSETRLHNGKSPP